MVIVELEGCSMYKGQLGELSLRYVWGLGKGRTSRVYCMLPYPAFAFMRLFTWLEAVTSWSHDSNFTSYAEVVLCLYD